MQSGTLDAPRSGSFIEAARRSQIVEAATSTVAEVGYANASLARIAERAGVSKSVISYHFDGKHDLLAQVAGTFFEQAWEHMAPRVEAATTATGRIAAWITSQCEYFAAHRARYLAMTEVVMNHRADDGSRPFIEDETEEVEAITAILADGVRTGELRELDPASTATIILQSLEGVVGAWSMDARIDLEAGAAQLVDFVDHAIRAERPTARRRR